jgi:hypothetical protein
MCCGFFMNLSSLHPTNCCEVAGFPVLDGITFCSVRHGLLYQGVPGISKATLYGEPF